MVRYRFVLASKNYMEGGIMEEAERSKILRRLMFKLLQWICNCSSISLSHSALHLAHSITHYDQSHAAWSSINRSFRLLWWTWWNHQTFQQTTSSANKDKLRVFFGWTRRTWRKKRRAKINVSLLNFGNQTGNSFSFVCSLTKDEVFAKVRLSKSLFVGNLWP